MPAKRPFSLRNKQEISTGRIAVEISELLRKRLVMALANLDHVIGIKRDPNDNWVTNTSVLVESARELAIVHADEELEAIIQDEPDSRTSQVRKYLKKVDGYMLMDYIEIFARLCERPESVVEQVNATMQEEGCRWKLFDGAFSESLPPIPTEIRQAILDAARSRVSSWSGNLSEDDFAARIVDVDSLPSSDARFKSFRDDIFQHRINNLDWPEDWIFTDSRVDLIGCDERRFIKFIELLLNPDIQSDHSVIDALSVPIARSLFRCGYRIDKSDVRVGISRYTVVHGTLDSHIGEGGFGSVRKTVIGKAKVAVKTLLQERRHEPDAVQRFKYEIECLKKLKHISGVIRLVAEAVGDDPFCYAMECADCSLEEYLLRLPSLSDEQRIELIDQILSAFVEIHASFVVHRDICPRNILAVGSELKVSDFGLALDRNNIQGLTHSSMRAGKYGYMAPELNDGFNKATELSDIFALGKVAQLVLTGKDPFAEPTGLFASVIRKATDHSSSRRFRDVGEMLAAMKCIRDSMRLKRTTSSLEDLAKQLTADQGFEPSFFHQLLMLTDPDDVYEEFWDPITTIMTGKRVSKYAAWAAEGGQILDYVKKCEEMYARLPGVGWPYRMIGSMCHSVIDPVKASNNERAMMLAFSLFWPIGIVSDQWSVRDILTTYLTNDPNSISDEFIGHVIGIVAGHGFNTKIQPATLQGMPAAIAQAIRNKMQEKEVPE